MNDYEKSFLNSDEACKLLNTTREKFFRIIRKENTPKHLINGTYIFFQKYIWKLKQKYFSNY